jgi:hypothetical protein
MRDPTWALCAVVFLAGIIPDVDHLAEGLSRQTHLPLVILALFALGVHLSLVCGYHQYGFLKGAVENG